MKRILVIGCPGSGKSTFSRKLSNIIKIPVIHLDNLYWNSDKSIVSKDLFRQRLIHSINQDTWIIDGNYISTMDLRLQHCDTIFYLDYPLDVCLDGVRNRIGTARPDLPWVETEEDPEFIQFIMDFNINSAHKINELLCKYSDRKIYHLKTREASNQLLNELEMEYEKCNDLKIK